MKIILRQNIDALGLEGDILEVANGYARNYLIPKGIALEANMQNIKLLETQKKKIEIKRLQAKESAEKIKERLNEVVVTISQKAGEEEKLYGSVTSIDIAHHLDKQGIDIDRRKIALDKPIKTLGEFEVSIRLFPEVTGQIKVVVVPENSIEKS